MAISIFLIKVFKITPKNHAEWNGRTLNLSYFSYWKKRQVELHSTLLSSLPTDSSSIRGTRVVTNSYHAFSNLYALARHGSCKDICCGGNGRKIFIQLLSGSLKMYFYGRTSFCARTKQCYQEMNEKSERSWKWVEHLCMFRAQFFY